MITSLAERTTLRITYLFPFLIAIARSSFLRLFGHIKEVAKPSDLTNRWSQPLVVVKSTFDFMKQFSMFATRAAASGRSAPSR